MNSSWFIMIYCSISSKENSDSVDFINRIYWSTQFSYNNPLSRFKSNWEEFIFYSHYYVEKISTCEFHCLKFSSECCRSMPISEISFQRFPFIFCLVMHWIFVLGLLSYFVEISVLHNDDFFSHEIFERLILSVLPRANRGDVYIDIWKKRMRHKI